MSSSKLPFILFFIVIVALFGGIFFMSSNKAQKGPTKTTSMVQNVTPTPSPALHTGTSNAQLDQDTTQIDNSLNSLNNDANAIDQGLNDQQTNMQ